MCLCSCLARAAVKIDQRMSHHVLINLIFSRNYAETNTNLIFLLTDGWENEKAARCEIFAEKPTRVASERAATFETAQGWPLVWQSDRLEIAEFSKENRCENHKNALFTFLRVEFHVFRSFYSTSSSFLTRFRCDDKKSSEFSRLFHRSTFPFSGLIGYGSREAIQHQSPNERANRATFYFTFEELHLLCMLY